MAGEAGRMVELCRKFVLLFFSRPPSEGSEAEAGAGAQAEEAEESMATTNAGPSPASIAWLLFLRETNFCTERNDCYSVHI